MSYLRYLVVFLVLAPNFLAAQNSTLTYDDVVFKREFSMGIQAHTNGFGINAHFVKINNIFKKTVYEIELMDIKHPKEYRNQSIFASSRNSARGYVYAKQNNFYNLNFTVGKIKMLAEKGRKSGVDIGLYYAGGLSLGLAKPYYLELIYGNGSNINFTTRDEKYEDGLEPEGNANIFLSQNRIYGASGFSFGLNEMKIYPGAKAKVALMFDWANYNEYVKALEVGAMVNVYASRVPILVALDEEIDYNKFLFLNLYVKFMFGKRW
ncbi:MAG: hypothetical protein R3E32_09150 [Chitinophagales bacterium]